MCILSEWWTTHHSYKQNKVSYILWRRTYKKFHHKIVQNSNVWTLNTMDTVMLWCSLMLAAHFWVTIFYFVVYRLSMAGFRLNCRIHIHSSELIVCGIILSSRIFIVLVCRHTLVYTQHTHTKLNSNKRTTTASTKDVISFSLHLFHFLHNGMRHTAVW